MNTYNRKTKAIFSPLVITAAILLTSHVSHGQSGQPSQVPQPVNVKVTNTPAEPVPVTGTVTVGNLGGTPLPVTGTVNVGNLGENVLVVREAAKNVLLYRAEDQTVPVIKEISVPQGKQLVLEWVSVLASGCTGLRVAVQTGGDFLGSQYWLSGTPRLVDEHTQVLSSQLKSYSKAGTPVEILVGKTLGSAPCSARIYASGYLLDLP